MEENNQVRNESNGVAIAGFILAFFIPLVGLILSIIGLSKSKKIGTGKGLSIAGIIISALSMILLLILIVAGTLYAINFASKEVVSGELGNSIKCVVSYNCKKLEDGNYECKYDSMNEETETIKCDKKYINEFNMRESNNLIDNNDVIDNNSTELLSCNDYSGMDKCVFFKEGNIEIERESKNDSEYVYYINNNKIDVIYIEKDDIKVLESDFVLINYSAESTLFKLYDKDGSIAVDFKNNNGLVDPFEVKYESKVLTYKATIIDDNVEDIICTYKPLDTIVYIEQEIKYENGNFSEPKTIKTKTLKEAAKEYYNKDC